jgi:glycine oxidase
MTHISIIGAGVAGLWTALLTKLNGFDVTLFDRDDENLSQGCSHRAGGMLAFNCEAESKDDIMTIWGKESLALWQSYFPDLITQNGSLLIAPNHDKDQLRYFEHITNDYQKLDTELIKTLESDLGNRFEAGLFYAHEAHLEPRICTQRLLKKCIELGVDVQFNHTIDHFNINDIYVDTTGLWAKKNLKHLRGVKGEMIIVKCSDIHFTRPIRLLHTHYPLYIVPRENNHYMIGATTIESENTFTNNHISVQSAGILLTQAFHLHPAFLEAEIIEMNVGYRPAFDDNKPQIIQDKNIFYLNGLYRHGWTIAPALANAVLKKLLTYGYHTRLQNI